MRRWRNLLARRGRYWEVPGPAAPVPPGPSAAAAPGALRPGAAWPGNPLAGQASPVPPPAQILRRGGALRDAARIMTSRSRRWDFLYVPAAAAPVPPAPAASAAPGAMWPGAAWPGDPLTLTSQAVPPAQFTRPAGSLRFAARLLPARRRRSDPAFGQASQGQALPSFTRQARTAPLRGLRLPRPHHIDPRWTLPAQLPPPQFLRPAGSLRAAARLVLSRRRRNDPGWGQAGQGNTQPQLTRPAGSPRFAARPLASRGRRFDPPWAAPAPAVPPRMIRQAGVLRFAAWLLPSPRRRSDPPWPQGPRGQAHPSFTAQPGAHPRSTVRLAASRWRHWDPPWYPPAAPVTVTSPACLSVTWANATAQLTVTPGGPLAATATVTALGGPPGTFWPPQPAVIPPRPI